MKNNELIKNFIKDLRVELMDEFDRNFQQRAFFSQSWQLRVIREIKELELKPSGAHSFH